MRRDYFGGWHPRETLVETTSPVEQYLELCARTRQALEANRPADAVTEARAALAVLPRGIEAQRLLGLALLEAGEMRPSLNAFQSALAADPLDLASQVGLAEARERLEGPGSAEDDWRRAWEIDPRTAELGERYLQARLAAGALDVEPGPPPLTRAALARIQLRSGLFEHAAAECRAVLAREPNRLDVQVTLAEAYWRAGDEEAAAGAASEILERQADCLVANILLAAYWQIIGRDSSALLARVTAVDPAGFVVARLFDDREVPWDLGQPAAEHWAQRVTPPPAAPAALRETRPIEPTASTPLPEPLAETRPLEPVHPAEHAEVVEIIDVIEVEATEPHLVDTDVPSDAERATSETAAPAPETTAPVLRQLVQSGPSVLAQRGGPEAVRLMATPPEPEPIAPSAASPTVAPDQPVARIAPPDSTEAVIPAPVASEEPAPVATPTELAPAEPLVAVPWREGPESAVSATPPVPEAAPDSLEAIQRAADQAMRERRYLAAMQSYGTLIEWLREQGRS